MLRRMFLVVLALVGLFGFAEMAQAARTINSVTLDGASSTTVAPGATISVLVNVTTDSSGGSNPTRWRSTGWRISTTGPGTLTCENHANHDSSGAYNETFDIAAPSTPGTYNAYFVAYGNDSCSSGASSTTVLASSVIVVAPLVINSVTLNGIASVTVGTGEAITAVVDATTNSSMAGYQWRSTGWRISNSAPGAMICVDHANHDTAGTFSETFSITAPATSGTYNAYFIAYNDNSCGAGASSTELMSGAVTILSLTEFNSSGGTTATNGLHFYLEDTTKIQVRRLNNTGQVYAPGSIPPSNSLDNGVFIRANGLVYGPSHTVTTFNPSGGMYNFYSITPASPANPSSIGVQQTATGTFGITAGPQVSVLWKYTTPLDFLIAEVTLTIPTGYAVSAANPVRYYHVFDTYLGGSDSGCGVSFLDGGKRVIGTYPPASGTCTSSTSIPAGVSVVESFRERSGQAFSNYCAAGWASFFNTGSPNCSVQQSAVMSNTVVTSYQDTGIGVELDFTAPGTYTFSYDFVIGSPNVPPYDHLEIRHDGAGTLCPDTVTVLACTSSAVPCPALSIVNTGTLTGAVTTTPAAPAITKTPATFTLGTSNSTQGVVLQAAGAGPVTLGTSGLSAIPVNGTKCWNTTTLIESCTLTFANTPCVGGYECLEIGATYKNLVTTPTDRNPLYTKLSGTNFKFDVVALQSGGAQASTYTAAANVTVELFADSASPAPNCSAYTSPIATQSITFAAGDSGRKTLSTNFNLANAYGKVRCRVSDANLSPTIYGCSSDDFAVRPQQLTVTAPTMNNGTLAGDPKAAAGTSFTMDAAAGVTAGYTGTPALDTSKVQDHASVAIAASTLSGSFSAGAGTKASGAAFKYLDVGNIKFLADAVVDSGFTSVDQTNDCVAGSTSNTLSGGKYGCNIGSAASATMGRWYPSHYSFTGSLTPACVAGSFTYMDNDALGVALTLKAHASSGGVASATDPVTSRYTTGYTNLAAVTISGDNNGAAVAVARLGSPSFPAMPNTALWTSGLWMLNDTYQFSKLAALDGPYELFKLKAAINDPDLSALIGAAIAQETGTTRVRSGRVRMQNAYGSELLDLPVVFRTEYLAALPNDWRINSADSCTASTLTFAAVGTDITANTCVWDDPASPASGKACVSAPAIANRKYLETGVTGTDSSGVAGFAGNFNLWLKAPGTGHAGSIDITANVPAWLQGATGNPKARATFGVYKSPLIYRRENY